MRHCYQRSSEIKTRTSRLQIHTRTPQLQPLQQRISQQPLLITPSVTHIQHRLVFSCQQTGSSFVLVKRKEQEGAAHRALPHQPSPMLAATCTVTAALRVPVSSCRFQRDLLNLVTCRRLLICASLAAREPKARLRQASYKTVAEIPQNVFVHHQTAVLFSFDGRVGHHAVQQVAERVLVQIPNLQGFALPALGPLTLHFSAAFLHESLQ